MPTMTRYPGYRQFDDNETDRLLFRGRDDEKWKLLHLVLAEKLVVMFGKSGIGKSSLLNAGIMELLREQECLPIRCRFVSGEEGPLEAVYAASEHEGSRVEEYYPGDRQSLWHFFKTTAFWSGDSLLTPVLILDQFEELFSCYDEDERAEFFAELGAAIEGRVPPKVLAEQREGRSSLTETAPRLKVVLTIQEDHLGSLEEMVTEIPAILHNRFRLSAMTVAQARLAIEEPAALEDDRFVSKPFSYEPNALQAMLDFLSAQHDGTVGGQGEIEPFQLQLLCENLERLAIERQDKEDGVVIRKKDLRGEAGMRKVLQQFYANQIRRLRPLWKRWASRRLCARGLISRTGKRLSLEEDEIVRKYRLSKSTLDELVKYRLIRAEPRVESRYYELSHGTLVDPIRQDAHERRRWIILAASVLGVAVAVFLSVQLASWTEGRRLAALEQQRNDFRNRFAEQRKIAEKKEKERQQAVEEAEREQALAIVNEANRLLFRAPQQAVELALLAEALLPTPQGLQALHDAVGVLTKRREVQLANRNKWERRGQLWQFQGDLPARFSRDGTHVLVATARTAPTKGVAYLLNSETLASTELKPSDRTVRADRLEYLGFSSTQNEIYLSRQFSIEVYSLAGRLKRDFSFPTTQFPITYVGSLSDDSKMILADATGSIWVVEPSTGRPTKRIERRRIREPLVILEHSDDGKYAVMIHRDDSAYLWRAGEVERSQLPQRGVLSVSFRPTAQAGSGDRPVQFATTGTRGEIVFWEVTAGRAEELRREEHAGRPVGYFVGPDNLLTLADDREPRVWNVETGGYDVLQTSPRGRSGGTRD